MVVEKEIQIRKSETCSTCDGTGVKPGSSKETCSKCNGTGEVRYAQQTPFGQFVRVATCDAMSVVLEKLLKKNVLPVKVLERKLKLKGLKVKVPAGVDTVPLYPLRGEGEAGDRGGPPGDLYIYITVREHEIFKRKGNDIYFTVPISFTDAALGAEIEIPTLEGNTNIYYS